MRSAILLILPVLTLVQGSLGAAAQGSPFLSQNDKSFLQKRLGIALDDDRTCSMTKAEAARLHRLIRAGDAADVRAYLDSVTLDQVFDETHHVPRADHCGRNP